METSWSDGIALALHSYGSYRTIHIYPNLANIVLKIVCNLYLRKDDERVREREKGGGIKRRRKRTEKGEGKERN